MVSQVAVTTLPARITWNRWDYFAILFYLQIEHLHIPDDPLLFLRCPRKAVSEIEVVSFLFIMSLNVLHGSVFARDRCRSLRTEAYSLIYALPCLQAASLMILPLVPGGGFVSETCDSSFEGSGDIDSHEFHDSGHAHLFEASLHRVASFSSANAWVCRDVFRHPQKAI